ncbi:calcium-binding protein [Streptomyces qinzhouensis]|uniref:Calcium-binding protein n=1 Tax=Streptomyces qinzhouensis TaxID=2599401 RepID=A0A5B8JBC4_9ACTN|nr:calcium-binding protein [Streptomyces qinzhouensis]QDY77221.1 calcium-binding protein [Streptomyces qinzhouensis]
MRATVRLALLGTSLAMLATTVGATTVQAADGGAGDIKINKVSVNGGKTVVVGTKAVSVKVSVTATDNSGISKVRYISAFGPSPNYVQIWDDEITCAKQSATTSTCTGTLTFDPQWGEGTYNNNAAATWKLRTLVVANDLDYIHREAAATFKVQRHAKVTANAAPEPVKKGKTITVTGVLSRADWNTVKYAGYGKQKVTLQYLKKGTKKYINVKTVTASATGSLKTTVKASADGYFRYLYAGNSATSAAASASDFVDVR